jgi:hypothetical protein
VSRWKDRDVADTAEALEKRLGGLRVEATLPWETEDEEGGGFEPVRLSEWVHWRQLRPRKMPAQTQTVAADAGGRGGDQWLVVELSGAGPAEAASNGSSGSGGSIGSEEDVSALLRREFFSQMGGIIQQGELGLSSPDSNFLEEQKHSASVDRCYHSNSNDADAITADMMT